jgi:polyphenol oxidase
VKSVQRLDTPIRDHGSTSDVIYYQFDQWSSIPALAHGVFTRIGGVSRAPFATLNVGGTVGDDPESVRSNLRRMYEILELDGSQACTTWQVHSADVVIAEQRVPGRIWNARADGIITDVPGLPLSMRFADCVPILLYDPVHRAIGLAHAGWRGTVQHVAANTVKAMSLAYGTEPADVQAAIGPSIGPDHYQVGEEVVEAVGSAFGAESVPHLIRRADDGSAYLNLWDSNQLDLERAGVKQVEVAGICTATHTDEFFSHRAERGKTGRFGAVIALKGL